MDKVKEGDYILRFRPITDQEDTSLNDMILDGDIKLKEIQGILKEAILNLGIREILSLDRKDLIPITRILKGTTSENKKKRFDEVESFLNKTAQLRKEFKGESIIQEINGKKYLIEDRESVYEVLTQTGDIITAYDPLRKSYIIYNYKDKEYLNASAKEFKKIGETNFYEIINNPSESNLFFVNNNSQLIDLGLHKIMSNINKAGAVHYFTSCIFPEENGNNYNVNIVNANGDIESIPYTVLRNMILKNNNEYLIIENKGLYTIYDCKNSKVLVYGANKYIFGENTLSFTLKTPRIGFKRFLLKNDENDYYVSL